MTACTREFDVAKYADKEEWESYTIKRFSFHKFLFYSVIVFYYSLFIYNNQNRIKRFTSIQERNRLDKRVAGICYL